MGDINLLPENERSTPRHRRPVHERVEYSSPTDETFPTKETPLTKETLVSAPAQRGTFLEWWKKRRNVVTTPSVVTHTAPLQRPQHTSSTTRHTAVAHAVSQQPAEHDAPKKDLDVVQMNLAHPTQPPIPQRHRYVATPAAVPAPQLVRSMPRQSKSVQNRSSRRQLSPGQPMPAADHETVNLLPDQLITELHPRNRWRDLAVTTLSAVVMVLLVYGGMNMYQQKIVVDTKQVEEDIAAVDTAIASYAELQTSARKVDEQLAGLETVLDGHTLWTPFLTIIEELTLPTVYYTSMSGSAASGSFTFDAVTATYDQIDPQIRVFRNDALVRSVAVSSAHEVAVNDEESKGATEAKDATEQRAIAFTMSVEFDPALFRSESSIHSE